MYSILEGHEALCKTDIRGFTRASKSRSGNEKHEHLEQRKSALAMAPNGCEPEAFEDQPGGESVLGRET